MGKRFPAWQVAIALVLMGGAALVGCQSPDRGSRTEPQQLSVTVSVVPQKYFVEQIGGDRVAVQTLIEPGIDPHNYELKADKLRELAKSKLFLAIGGNLEKNWLSRLRSTYPNLKIVDTSRGVDFIPLAEQGHTEQGHTEQGHTDLTGGDRDPHIWLSPSRVKIQAENIYQALIAADPSNQAFYQANRDRFLVKVDALDRELRDKLKPLKQRKFMVFHPEWGYFAHDYDLQMVAIEVDGNEPSAAELAQIIQQAKAENIRLIVVQPELSQRSAEAIAMEIHGKILPITVFSEDWMGTLRKMADILLEADSSAQSVLPSFLYPLRIMA